MLAATKVLGRQQKQPIESMINALAHYIKEPRYAKSDRSALERSR
jgi:hypothetical protein